jgi:hypothetical protein
MLLFELRRRERREPATATKPALLVSAHRETGAGALQLLVVSLEEDRAYARGLESSFLQELGQARAG